MTPELDNFSSCIHGIIPVGKVCGICEEDHWNSICNGCGVSTMLRLGSAYECDNEACIEDHEGALVWEIQDGEKVMLEPLKTPYAIKHFLEGV